MAKYSSKIKVMVGKKGSHCLISFDESTTIKEVANVAKMTATKFDNFGYCPDEAEVKLNCVPDYANTRDLSLDSTMGDAFTKAFRENAKNALAIIKSNPEKKHGLALHFSA